MNDQDVEFHRLLIEEPADITSYEYVYYGGGESVGLDGDFTVEQLTAIAKVLKEIKDV